jgi:hypothetical protein
MSPQALPAEFSDLEPFLETWGKLETAQERYLVRQQSRMADLQAFYDAIAPRIEQVLNHLDRFPIDTQLPRPEDTLFRLALALAEVTPAVEIYKQPEVPFVPRPHVVSTTWTNGGG